MINKERLPRVAMIDAGVVIRWLRPKHKDDKHSSACRLFVNGMIEANRRIFIPAPVLAEVLRFAPEDVPQDASQLSTSRVVIAPFDRRAAEILGEKLPMHVLKGTRGQETSSACMKYDAMIVACAKRWADDLLVSCDQKRDIKSIANRAGVRLCEPRDFQDPLEQLWERSD